MRAYLASIALFCLAAGAHAVPISDPKVDDYAWLEDTHGAKPLEWVAQHNKASLGPLKADPRYQQNYDSILQVLDATDRIPMGTLRGAYVYNFWQDATNPKGLWRRTAIADYQTAAPKWELLLDVDALAKAEKENWVFKGAECGPKETRCLIRLSRGGGDAVVIREYDLKAKALATDGFALPEAKSDASYLDDDTVLFATAKDGETSSGYARKVRLWARGQAIADAPLLYEGAREDVLAAPMTAHTKEGNAAFVVRAVSFFETEHFAVEGTHVRMLDMPRSADVKGMLDGALIATLRDDYAVGGAMFAKGSLVAFRDGKQPQTIFAPHARQSVESVATGRDKLFVVINDNVIGTVHVFTPGADGWSDKVLALPGSGSPDIVSANDYGPEAMFSFQNYLTPTTPVFRRRQRPAQADQVAAGAVRCVGTGDGAV